MTCEVSEAELHKSHTAPLTPNGKIRLNSPRLGTGDHGNGGTNYTSSGVRGAETSAYIMI